jgi:ribonuclease Z
MRYASIATSAQAARLDARASIIWSVVLDAALVGTSGMMPLPNRWLSSVLLRYAGRLILFDCGEGTQISLRGLGWGFKAIDLILISHVHGDHVTGLPGLLLTLGNAGRTEVVRIVGPTGFSHVLERLLVVAPYLPFPVECRELVGGDSFDSQGLSISCADADHHVACLAYRIDVPRGRRFLPEQALQLGVPIHLWSRLQRGEAVDGIQPESVLGPPRRGLSVGLVTDTRPSAALVELVGDVDLLFGEGMYGSDEDHPRAVERRHMTFREMAELARSAHAKQLVLTHFSPSLVDPQAFADLAREVFPHTIVGSDHLAFSLGFTEDE